jgi:hypothetical protein
MMVHFRKRITPEILARINDIMVNRELKKADNNDSDGDFQNAEDQEDRSSSTDKKPNAGIMMVDASVTPADIAYPTDLNLLNESREKLEEIIDVLYEPMKGEIDKPRTYRLKARQAYLKVAKQRKSSYKAIKKTIKRQLQYISRDLQHIEALKALSGLGNLSSRQYRKLLVIHELHRQQREMYDAKTHSVPDRIVNISQPHVRPVVRGKASADVEFGAKIVVSRINGYHVLEAISWDNFNESRLLQTQIERYRERMGFYPEAVLADKLYRNRNNLAYCKERNIRLSGPKLGRPEKDTTQNKRRERIDSSMRNAIEGTFGIAKRRYGLGRIMMKLKKTSETSISLVILLMNLEKILRDIFIHYLFQYILILKRKLLIEFQAA